MSRSYVFAENSKETVCFESFKNRILNSVISGHSNFVLPFSIDIKLQVTVTSEEKETRFAAENISSFFKSIP